MLNTRRGTAKIIAEVLHDIEHELNENDYATDEEIKENILMFAKELCGIAEAWCKVVGDINYDS